MQNINNADVREFKVYPVPPQEEWRLPLPEELIQIGDHHVTLDNFTTRELGHLIEQVFTK